MGSDDEVDWGGLAVSDARPAALPDLSALQPLVLHARYARGGEADVTIRNKVGGKPHAQKVHVVLPNVETRNAAISRLWARETIAELERRPRGVPVDAEAITRIALAHDLMSRYTAFIATDSSGPKSANGSPLLVKQPNEAPADVDLASAGGVVAYAPTPDGSPAEEHYGMVPAVESRGGGCAGCTSAPSSGTKPARAHNRPRRPGARPSATLLRLVRRSPLRALDRWTSGSGQNRIFCSDRIRTNPDR